MCVTFEILAERLKRVESDGGRSTIVCVTGRRIWNSSPKMTILTLTFMKNVNVVETFLIWTSTRWKLYRR